jgi:hypothetical protein
MISRDFALGTETGEDWLLASDLFSHGGRVGDMRATDLADAVLRPS